MPNEAEREAWNAYLRAQEEVGRRLEAYSVALNKQQAAWLTYQLALRLPVEAR